MERMKQNALDILRQANRSLSRFFDRFGVPLPGTADEVEALLQLEETLHAVGVLLLDGRLRDAGNSELQTEIARYRQSLVALRRQLSLMQDSAMACRARLYSREEHLHAVRAWCSASRDTQ
jgi:hypothetical protein